MEIERNEYRWSYTPPGYFEARTLIALPHGKLVLENGEAVLTTTSFSRVSRADRSAATELVRTVLDARRSIVGTPYTLSAAAVAAIGPSGERHYTVFAEGRAIGTSSARADFILTDPTGKVVRDSKAERIASETATVSALTEMAVRSTVLRFMLHSLSKAADEPQNALVHLYQIRDAAAKQFGSKTAACRALELPEGEWDRLGDLANSQPLLEGRHRGKMAAELRKASPSELNEARRIAIRIIHAFAASLAAVEEGEPGSTRERTPDKTSYVPFVP